MFLLWPVDTNHQLLLVATLCGVSAVAVISNGAMRRSSLGLLVPMWLIAFARLFSSGDAFHVTVGLLAMVFLAIMINSAWEIGGTIANSIRLRFENVDLVERLSREKSVAESASRAKTIFLAAASHDMRQPAHALGLFLRALDLHARAPQIDRDKVTHLLEKSRQALSGFSKLTDSLLDISKLDSGTMEMRADAIELNALFQQIENEFSNAAVAKNLALRVRRTSLIVRSDATALRRIVANLVDNGIRYTEQGGVLLGCRRRGPSVEICVADTGSGIPANEHHAIYDEFYQLGNVERNRERGLGLGLAIVRRLCDVLGHRLAMRSILGRGSCFRVGVPFSTASLAKDVVPETIDSNFNNAGRTVLAIDDDVDVLEAMRQLLFAWGFSVIVTRSASEAIEESNIVSVDALIVDYRLQGRETGDQAARRIYAKIGRTIPTLIITGDTAPQRILEAKASGFPLLHKPLDADELQRQLDRLLTQREVL